MPALVLVGTVTLILTELLSAFSALRRGPLIACWAVVLLAALAVAARRPRPTIRFPGPDWVTLGCWTGVTAILALTGITAVFSAPNSADAMAYHMPRVVYWAEQSSVRFFPTPYLNQVMLQPLAEYFMLHTYVVSGGDRWINLVQWLASAGCIFGVSAVAAEFGFGPRGRALAALFCATIPAGILASSGAKNDYVLALWLMAAVYFALRYAATLELRDAVFLGLALGLALLTKATAYLYAPWPLLAILAGRRRPRRLSRLAAGAALALACSVALNVPHYARNHGLSGSIFGFDSAQGDGLFRWTNETFGWKQTVSNLLRNTSEQMGGRSSAWNQRVYREVVELHNRMGIAINDPSTTWRWSFFRPPRNANHEANAPNRWHLALLTLLSLVLVWRALNGRDGERALYALSLATAFLAFCACLKWQPYLARLFLPLFVLGSPLAGLLEEWPTRRGLVAGALALFLLDSSRLAIVENWTRPLKGPNSVLRRPREEQYFADMNQWGNRGSYISAVEQLRAARCRTVGIDAHNLQLEYPLQALLRARDSSVVFLHTGVANASARYRPPVAATPCAIVCLDCAGDPSRLALYPGYRVSTTHGKFVVMLNP